MTALAAQPVVITPAAPAERRIAPLDGLRGLAALSVLVDHFFDGFAPRNGFDTVIFDATQGGWAGVDLFFVLSGFLITGILLDTKGGEHYFRRFYLRRILRIFPLYYAALAILFLLPRIFTGHSLRLVTEAAPDQAWFWTYTDNWLFALKHHWLGTVSPFWSLAVEEQFYMVWPLIVLLLSRQNLMRLCVVCIVTSLAVRCGMEWDGSGNIAPYVVTPARMDALAIGGLIACAARGPGGLAPLIPAARWALAACTAGLAVVIAVEHGLWQDRQLSMTLGITLLSLFFGAIVLLAVAQPAAAAIPRLFSARPLRFLGTYSYCLYMVHAFVRRLVERGMDQEPFQPILGTALPGRLVFFSACTAATIALAVVSWHCFEKPILSLKRYT